jgi:hypothetical protein
MSYGVIESTSMSIFVEGVLSLELPLSKRYIISSYSITTWDWGEHEKGRAQIWTGF